MKRALLILVIMGTVAAADFLDDFESYTPGQDPEASGNWMRDPFGGHAWVVDQEGDQVLEAAFEDSLIIGYLCTAAGFWDDGSVSMSFGPDGDGCFCSVLSRLQITTGETYAGGIMVTMQPFTYGFIAYINAQGDYELLWSGFGPIMMPGDWVDVELEVSGNGPVELTLLCNGEQAGTAADSVYDLASGLSGFALLYQEAEPVIFSDDFEVVLDPVDLAPRTFGEIKTLFL
jgi:hypothetical protein